MGQKPLPKLSNLYKSKITLPKKQIWRTEDFRKGQAQLMWLYWWRAFLQKMGIVKVCEVLTSWLPAEQENLCLIKSVSKVLFFLE